MAENKLNITSISQSSPQDSKRNSFRDRQQELQAICERLWLQNPEQFNPLRNAMERERLDRTWAALQAYFNLAQTKVADIGCGNGVFSRRMRDAGAEIEAVDIAENALKHLKQHDLHHIHPKRDGLPYTMLPDQAYNLIVCTEVIGFLNPQDHRLFFSELARLIKPDGLLICSSEIDIYTEGGVEQFQALTQTEFVIMKIVRSYHALFIKLQHFLEAPAKFVKGGLDARWRKEELNRRLGLNRLWFKLNSHSSISWLWKPISYTLAPLIRFYKQNRHILLTLEKVCQFFWDEAGVSHVIFLGQRRPLQWPEPSEPPITRPGKKEIWT